MSQSDKLDNLKKRAGKNTKTNSEKETTLDGNIETQVGAENNYTHSNKNEKEIEDISKQFEIRIASLESELKDWQQRTARLSAEIANLQKQHELDLAGAKKAGKKSVSSQLITFLNTLNLSFSFAPKLDDIKVKSFVATLESSFEKVISDLKLTGVEIILPKEGDEFNAEIMAALDISANTQDQLKVSKIAGLGYKIDGQVVQPASVLLG
jgi:molecular chaperone GrpE (heat shock protein)